MAKPIVHVSDREALAETTLVATVRVRRSWRVRLGLCLLRLAALLLGAGYREE